MNCCQRLITIILINEMHHATSFLTKYWFSISVFIQRSGDQCFAHRYHNYTEAPLRYEVAYPPLTHFLGWRDELAIRLERQFFLKWKKIQTPIMDGKWNEWKDLLCPKAFHVTVWSESPVVCIVHCSKIDLRVGDLYFFLRYSAFQHYQLIDWLIGFFRFKDDQLGS